MHIIERIIVERVVWDLLHAGYDISVDDGVTTTLKKSANFDSIMRAILNSVEAWLLVSFCGAEAGWVHLLHGNRADVICDFSRSLEGVLAGANKLAEEFQ